MGYHLSSRLISDLSQNSCACASAHFEVNQTKIKGGCQSGKKVVPHDSKSDLPLHILEVKYVCFGFIWKLLAYSGSLFYNFYRR